MNLKKTLLFALLSLSTPLSHAGTFTFSLDNDGIFGVDKDYTNGLFLSYYSDEVSLSPILTPITSSFGTFGGAAHKVGFTLGQTIYTPKKIEESTPQADQRPYAGVLFFQTDIANISAYRADRYGFLVGSTGPNSLADVAQDFIHSITGSTQPEGWDYQVEDQILGNFEFETHNALFRSRASGGTQHEIKNISRVMAGNYRSEIATGMMWRWGSGLDSSIGAARVAMENSFLPGMIMQGSSSAYLFAGVEGRYRFNDITIDGPVPDEVYPVTLQNAQATASLGAVWYNQTLGASFTFSAKTSDFQEDETSAYGVGALTLFGFF